MSAMAAAPQPVDWMAKVRSGPVAPHSAASLPGFANSANCASLGQRCDTKVGFAWHLTDGVECLAKATLGARDSLKILVADPGSAKHSRPKCQALLTQVPGDI